MSPAIVLTAAAAAILVSVLANSRCRNREGMSVRGVSTAHEPFDLLANNMQAAANRLDDSAAEIELVQR